MEDVVKIIDDQVKTDLPARKMIIPDQFRADENTGIKVEITYDPTKNHLNVNAGIEDGDELVLMMLRKAYHTWRKRVLDNIDKGN